MSTLQPLLNILAYVPGALEAAIFLVVYLAILALRRSFESRHLSDALFVSSLLWLALYAVLDMVRAQFYPMLLLTFVATVTACWYFRRRKAPYVALAYSVFLIAVGHVFFTHVARVRSFDMTWEISAPQAPSAGEAKQATVILRHESPSGYHTAEISDELAKFLREKKPTKVKVDLELLYHWGRFAGLSLRSVEGRQFTQSAGGFAGCLQDDSHDCERSPYPMYYFGLRKLKRN